MDMDCAWPLRSSCAPAEHSCHTVTSCHCQPHTAPHTLVALLCGTATDSVVLGCSRALDVPGSVLWDRSYLLVPCGTSAPISPAVLQGLAEGIYPKPPPHSPLCASSRAAAGAACSWAHRARMPRSKMMVVFMLVNATGMDG